MKNKSNFIIKLILILLLTSSCQGAKEALQGNQRSDGSDEFLVEKKNPLSMPPDFNELPEPSENLQSQETLENDKLKNKLQIKTKRNIDTKNSETSIEKKIIEKIKD